MMSHCDDTVSFRVLISSIFRSFLLQPFELVGIYMVER